MKEKAFEKELKEIGFDRGIKIRVYYTLDDEGHVVLDEDSMNEEFEMKIREVKGILE